ASPALFPTRQAAPEEARPQIAAPAARPTATPANPTHAPHSAERARPAALATPAPTPPTAQSPVKWAPALPAAARDAPPPLAPLPEDPSLATDISPAGNFPAGPAHNAPASLFPAPETPASLVPLPTDSPAAHEAVSTGPGRISLASLPAALPLNPPLPRMAAAPPPEPGFTAPVLPPVSAGSTGASADPGSSTPFAARPVVTPRPPRATTPPATVIVYPLSESSAPPAVPGEPDPVEVRIGTIEIRATAPTPPAPIVPSPQPRPAPAARPAPSFPRSYSWRFGIAQA